MPLVNQRTSAARTWKGIATVAMMSVLTACAWDKPTEYQPEGLTGGYGETRIDDTTWRVGFYGNGRILFHSAETYWLYRSAELTLAKGFDGFSIIDQSEDQAEQGKPKVEGVIVLLKHPITPVRRLTFDARAVIADLQGLVLGPRCGNGNVCWYKFKNSMASGLFMRMFVISFLEKPATLTVGHETAIVPEMTAIKVHESQNAWHEGQGANFRTLQFPREREQWQWQVTVEACTYAYQMPKDVAEDPVGTFADFDGRAVVQLAPDLSLHILPPHATNWEKAFNEVVKPAFRPTIIPVKTCRRRPQP